MNSHQELETLRKQASELRNGPAKVALLERAVQLADEIGIEEMQYNARTQLVTVGTFGSGEDRALAAFTWCLSRFDEDPSKYRPRQIFGNSNGSLDCCSQLAVWFEQATRRIAAEFNVRNRNASVSESLLEAAAFANVTLT